MQCGTLLRVTRHRPAAVALRYPVVPQLDDWVLPEGNVPESVPHNTAARHLELLLEAWAERSPHDLAVGRNLAIRWLEERPQVGIDPDVCLLAPPSPDFERLGSLCLWKPGHEPPPLCFEVVSSTHPNKDYTAIQDRYAAMGAFEVVVFDPQLIGPRSLGGPVALQVWRCDSVGLLERVHFGAGPAYSEVLDAWLVPEGGLLAISEDRTGSRRWLTGAERERAARTELEREVADLRARRG